MGFSRAAGSARMSGQRRRIWARMDWLTGARLATPGWLAARAGAAGGAGWRGRGVRGGFGPGAAGFGVRTWRTSRHTIRSSPPGQPQRGGLPYVAVAGIGTAGDLLDDRGGAAELDQPDS